MRETSKSVVSIAGEALAVGEAALPRYAGKSSRRDGSTLPQRFAVLAVRKSLGQDCRGVRVLLNEWSGLREAIGLTEAPDYSTPRLGRSQARSRRGAFDGPLHACFVRAGGVGLPDATPEAAVDPTGTETHHARAHFRRRVGRTECTHEAWPELSAAAHCPSHLIAATHACRGPTQDSPHV